MGHGKKNQSRHQQITKNRERIGEIANAMKGLAQTLGKEEEERVERFETIEAEQARVAEMLNDLAVEVRFNALPFWKRWIETWRTAREATKDAHRPPFIGSNVEGPTTSNVEGPTTSNVEGPTTSNVEGPGDVNPEAAETAISQRSTEERADALITEPPSSEAAPDDEAAPSTSTHGSEEEQR